VTTIRPSIGADEDLRPFGETHGQWRCGACQRVFALKYLGIASDWTSPPLPARPTLSGQTGQTGE
jgi:hypothetical protein